jgi:hypothetical protein
MCDNPQGLKWEVLANAILKHGFTTTYKGTPYKAFPA